MTLTKLSPLLLVCLALSLTGCRTILDVTEESGDRFSITVSPEVPTRCTLKNFNIDTTVSAPIEYHFKKRDQSKLTIRCQPEGYDAVSMSSTPYAKNYKPSPAVNAGNNVLFPPGVIIDSALAKDKIYHGYRDFDVPLIKEDRQVIEIDTLASIKDPDFIWGVRYLTQREVGMACDIRTEEGSVKLTSFPARINIKRSTQPLSITCCRQSGSCKTRESHPNTTPSKGAPLLSDDSTAIIPRYYGKMRVIVR